MTVLLLIIVKDSFPVQAAHLKNGLLIEICPTIVRGQKELSQVPMVICGILQIIMKISSKYDNKISFIAFYLLFLFFKKRECIWMIYFFQMMHLLLR